MNKAAPNFYDVDMPIRSFITKRLIGVRSKSSVQEAAKKMVEFNTGSLVVIEDEDIVGFITDGDIKKKVVAEGLKTDMPVKEIMVKELITADISSTIKDVLEIMAEKNIQHILIDEDDDIVGIVTFRDLIDIKRQKLETYISRE
ncbi:MAG: CBS domain-containing protein [Candidatus Natronoplasma sp.]